MKVKTTKEKYSNILNSTSYSQLRNNNPAELRKIFRDYSEIALRQQDRAGSATASMVALYNKTYQCNPQGFIEYLETKCPQKYFVAALY